MGTGRRAEETHTFYHLDCPWRPADLQQREGRIIRQGNDNPESDLHRCKTLSTLSYQLVESKQSSSDKILTSKSLLRLRRRGRAGALMRNQSLVYGQPAHQGRWTWIDVARLAAESKPSVSIMPLRIKLKEIPKVASLEQRIAGYKTTSLTQTNTHPNEDGFSPMVKKERHLPTKRQQARNSLTIRRQNPGGQDQRYQVLKWNCS